MEEDPLIDGDIVNASFSTRAPKVRLRALRYLRRKGELGCVLNVTFIFLIVGVALLAAGWWITGGISLVMSGAVALTIYRYVSLRKIEFRHALLVPGVVFSSDPLRVAVLANMSCSGERSVLAVQTLHCKDVAPFPKDVGTRIPCVAAFLGDGPEQWDRVIANSLADGTGDVRELDRCLARFSDGEWEILEQFVARTTFPETESLVYVEETSAVPPPLPKTPPPLPRQNE